MIRIPNGRCSAGHLAPASGFTLIELLVTLAVAGVLLAIAGPALKGSLSERAVVAQASELAEAMRFARAEAMKRGGPVTLCKLSAPPGPAGMTGCAATPSTTWRYWAVFAERAGNGAIGTFDRGDIALRVQSDNPGNVDYGTDSPPSLRFITFESTGIALSDAWDSTKAGHAANALVITLSPAIGGAGTPSFKRRVRQVCLSAQGRVAVVDGDGSCA